MSDNISKMIVILARLHFKSAQAILSEFGLGRGQPPILQILTERDGITQKEIAQTENITPATATVTLQSMEKSGLIERKTDKDDLRSVRVYITEKGKDIYYQSKNAIDKMDAEIDSLFTQEEKEEFIRLSHKLKDGMTERRNSSNEEIL